MAYLDFSAIDGAAPLPSLRQPAIEDGFSPLEWTVIELARRDPVSSMEQPSRLALAVARFLGRSIAQPLADKRLEALRRFAINAWHHGYVLPAPELTRFLAAGFTPEQAETLIGHAIFSLAKPDRKIAA